MFELPRIRIEVERMKYQIIHAFTSHNDEIEKVVESELTKAIDNYPFAEQIRKEASEVIKEAVTMSIKNFFLYGEGYEAIDSSVKEAISKSISKDK